MAAARGIGEQLEERCLRTGRGSATWFGPTGYGTQENPLRVVQLGPNLYDGTSGIAVFLAALARVTGEARFRDLAHQALLPLRERLVALAADPSRAGALRMSVGGLMGLSSYLYALLRVGTLLEEPAWVDAAHAASALVTPERIAADARPRL
ncbi:lanthionine synthetase LanC family protein, partial [Pyxidicoccus sp. 3LG]